MTAAIDPSRHTVALVVTAHPDDAEFLFGATIAWLIEHDVAVFYLVCSDGALGGADPAAERDSVARIRCAEQVAAARMLGVRDVTFLGLPDGTVVPTLELRTAIAAQVRLRRPTVVLTHYPHRVLAAPVEASHPDHLAVGEATLAAIYPTAGSAMARLEFEGRALAAWRPAEIWLTGYGDRDEYCIDAVRHLSSKVAAILCHTSQLGDTPEETPPWLLDWMRGIGVEHGFEYGESFTRIML
ncbi:PIG-L deacetylase family protein [Nocardia sp. NPDC060256]|uniref:PIG-L deacetylase family protein n=1 Tax=unclassified Nocardia TaxID=2637762 RepID=UPI0036536172